MSSKHRISKAIYHISIILKIFCISKINKINKYWYLSNYSLGISCTFISLMSDFELVWSKWRSWQTSHACTYIFLFAPPSLLCSSITYLLLSVKVLSPFTIRYVFTYIDTAQHTYIIIAGMIESVVHPVQPSCQEIGFIIIHIRLRGAIQNNVQNYAKSP